jgi:FkbM family methyltransferase
MKFCIPLPGTTQRLDIIDPVSTAVQRAIRTNGLAEYEPSTAAALLSLFSSHPTSLTFYDVGANMGVYSELCASLFPDASVVAFEPTPATAKILQNISTRNDLGIQVETSAVGDEIGTLDLYLSPTSDASNSLVAGFRQATETIKVPVTTIDEFVNAGGPAPDVIKIDVETYEPSVLRGARETLRKHRPSIVIEVLKRNNTDHGPDIETLVADLSYKYYHLGPEPDWQPLPHIYGVPHSQCRDWLLTPSEIGDQFPTYFSQWKADLAECGPERNDRPSNLQMIGALRRHVGWRKIVPKLQGIVFHRIRRRVQSLRTR